VKCFFDFSDSFLPIGLFPRLLCLCVGFSNKFKHKATRRPELYKNFGTVELSPGSIIHLQEEIVSQRIILFAENVERSAKCLFIILSMLRKLNSIVMGEGLEWKVIVETDGGKLLRLDEAQNQTMPPWYTTKTTDSKTQGVDLDYFLDSLES